MEKDTNKNELEYLYKVIDKLDTAIDKLADVSSDIKQILAVHETRLDQTESIVERSFVQLDAVHHRVSALRDDMNSAEKDILNRINDINKWRWQIMGAAAVIAFIISAASHMLPM